MMCKLFFYWIIVLISVLAVSQSIASNNSKAGTIKNDSNKITFQIVSSADSSIKRDTLTNNDSEIRTPGETFKDRRDLAFRGIENLASTFSGVLKQDNSSLLNIRGGLNSQTKISVDGMIVNNPFDNGVNIYLPNEIIENMVINTNDIDISEKYAGQISISLPERYDNYYGFVKALSDGFLSSKNKTLGTYSYGYNEYLMVVGGPVIPGEKHSFFLSATRRWLQDFKPSWGWAENEDKPEELNESVIPGNTNSEWSIVAKAKYNLSDNINITGNLIRTDRAFSDINPLFLYNPEHASYWTTNHRSYRISWNHKINPDLSYQVSFKYFSEFIENYDRFFKDNLWDYGDPNFNPLLVSDENYGLVYTDRYVPDFFKPGVQYNNYYKNKTKYNGFDFDIKYQLNEHHNLKVGFEYKKHTLRKFQMLNPAVLASKSNLTLLERYRLSDVRFYGYDLEGNEVDDGDYFDLVRNANSLTPESGFDKQAPYEPIVMSAFLQDKIEYNDLVLNLGLRYDRIDPNAWQFKNQEAQLDDNGNIIPGTGMFGRNEIFDESDIEDSEVHEFISPRITALFNVNHNFSLYANYGRYILSSNWKNQYLSPFFLDSWVNRGGYFLEFNNPDLEPSKSTSYEIGTNMYINPYTFIKVSIFYREIYDLPTYFMIPSDVTEIAFLRNGEEYSVKGFDINLILTSIENIFIDFNFGIHFKNDAGYSSSSNYNYTYSNSRYYPLIPTPPRDFEKQYSGSINLSYSLKENQGPLIYDIYPFENFNLNLLARFYSGKPYERLKISSSPFTGRYDEDPLTLITNETTPSVFRFDLKISKKFSLPLNTYLKTSISVLNLFNSEIIKDVWTTTGKPNETGYLNTQAGQEYWTSLTEVEQQNYLMREMDFNHYGNPRQLRFELEVGF